MGEWERGREVGERPGRVGWEVKDRRLGGMRKTMTAVEELGKGLLAGRRDGFPGGLERGW